MHQSARDIPTFVDVVAAARRLSGRVHRTPISTSTFFDRSTGCRIHFKCENLQRIGAFKARGALNAILLLSDEERLAGVVTHSSGNHGQAVAWAARSVGAKATVIMPRDSAAAKLAAVRDYGAEVILCDGGTAAREAATEEVRQRTGAIMIHPYDDARVMAGQGTAALELLEEVPNLDAIITPVGGGGLLSGTALAAHGRSATIRVIGAEPAAADDATRSLASGRIECNATLPRTIADGLRATSIGERPFAVIRDHVQTIYSVSESEIVQALKLVLERMKLVIEPSSAVPVAALLKHGGELRGQSVGVILSGGNLDLGSPSWL